MRTKITELLQIEYPIFQGGMAWVAEHKLAAAASNAGGLGIIGAASAPPEVVREEIRKCKELTDKPFGVNIMLLNPNAEEVAKIVVEEGVKAVTTGAGNPGKFMELWKNAGVKVIPVVASVAMAKMMERAGADAVVAEGMESGGHIGSTTTMALVPQVVDAVSIPVFGNGDVVDGPSAKRLMDETGCAGVAVGRAAWGNPWVFESINAYLENGTILPDPTPEERLDMAELHLKGLAAWKGEYVAVREMRAHASHYFHGLRKATELRRGIMKAQTEKEFIQLLHAYKEQFRGV